MCERSLLTYVGLATVISIMLSTLRARAQTDAPEPLPQHTHEVEHEATRFQVGVDLVSGWERDATSRFSALGLRTPFNSESLLLQGSARILPKAAIGARFPVSVGSNLQGASGTTIAPGNLELEGEYETELGEHTQLVLGLGVSLPTAHDAELFATAHGAADHAGAAAVTGHRASRSSLLYAAKRARGFEDAALFEAGRLGVIPKAQLSHRIGMFALESFLKLENMLLVHDSHEHGYMGELVLGGFAGFELARLLTVGARLWANFAVDRLGESVWVAEPQARAQLGPVRVALGTLLWFVEPLDESALTGLRFLAAAQF